MKKIILLICLSLPFPLMANDSLKEKLRPYCEKIAGTELCDKFFGVPVILIELPVLPRIDKSATATSAYDGPMVDPKDSALTPEQQKQFNYQFVREVYVETRNMKANDDELSKWLNTMDQGSTREGIYRALVLDNTYAGLENYPLPFNDGAFDLAVLIYNKYVGKPLTKEKIKELNFYTLKRITVENALDIVDAYQGREDDLYRWYAVLSSELVSKFPSIWQGKIRTVGDADTHYRWAKSVPLQHLKSELIIKLHHAFNQFKG